MSGKAISGTSRAELRQLPPQRCPRCRKKIRDGTGKRISGVGIVCTKCAGKAAS